MNSRLKELPVNDKKYIYKVLLNLGVSQSGLARLLDCSNVVSHWARGYRRVPRSFRRFILVMQFIKNKGLMEELLQHIKEEERKC
ncbi:hypothetical protein [Dickeya phage JA15]|uniref:Uncharacterized protein n=3 Tax=Limestonevirus limestone TaxID=1091052 RepID=A0A7L4YHR2_9CAUD|nr:hypothetical protein [Dickeya phage JA15]QHB41734.1 hypothetical protein [Dickeya phage Ds9CZ]QHB42765.1 hypothetical protein [Dickeya phage Ds3CZ]